jgi:hypothetical protein
MVIRVLGLLQSDFCSSSDITFPIAFIFVQLFKLINR